MPPKRPPSRKRQTKINFSPTAKPATQPVKPLVLSDSEDELSPNRPAKRRRTEEGTARGMRLGMPVQPSGRAGMFGSLDLTNDTPSGTSNSDETERDVKRKKEKKEKKNQKNSKKAGEASNSIEIVVPKKSRQRKSRQQKTPEEESTEEIQVIPRSKSKPRTIRKQHVKTEGSDEEDEDDAPRTRSRRLRTTARDSSSEDVVSDEEQSESEQEDENEHENQGNSEEEELKEDLAFLRSSPVADRGRLRSTGNKVKSDREKALEALKKRRAGTNEPSFSAATPGRRKPVIIESDSESGSDLDIIEEEKGEEADLDDGDEEVDEIEDDDDDAVNAHDVFRETNEDEDFIDDEDEGLLGAPAEDTQMPLAFTGLSTAKPRDLFKYAIEWSVHKKINPSFASDDEIYVLTFRKLNDEVNGLANSKFHSSAWTSDFSRAIKARPDLLVNELSTGMKSVLDPHCEACNRKNHVASWEISLTGVPYNYNTLEPLAEESGENSDSDSSSSSSSLSSSSSEANLNGEKPTYNEVGERIPPASKTFTLGSTCKANAQVAHTLYHWRYHLHGWVVGYLEREGYFKPDQLVKREKWSDRKRSKKANKIVDKMEKEGEIKRLHRLYKQQVDFAVEAENEYKKGWGRRG